MNDQTIDLEPPTPRSKQPIRLRVIEGPHDGMQWVFDRSAEVTLGRTDRADLVLPQENSLSGLHLSLKIEPPHVEMLDEHSRNGTFVNGLRMAGATLRHGDRFGVGDTLLTIELLSNLKTPHPLEQTAAFDPQENNQRTSNANPSANPIAAKASESPSPETIGLPATLDGSGGPPSPSTPSAFFSADSVSGNAASVGDRSDDQIVGSYHLGELLGSGGMASVYKATHRRTGKVVAIKLIRSDLPQTDKRLRLFVREADVLTRLRHPRIVQAFEFGIEGSFPYLVMQFVPTIDLLDLTDALPLNNRIRTANWITLRVLQAVQYLHKNGIVHRDIKPSNILAYRNKHRLHLKLADFGLAKIYADAGISGLTNERSVRGTIAYMSPEQLYNSRDSGPSDDVFSCGACLYRILVGEVPNMAFQSKRTLEKLHASPLPQAMIRLINKSISLSLEERFNTANELAIAIQNYNSEA
ncbi:Serine/threonine-protein kinase PknB [Roseimaritima multifibrata]|uniref:Serine/threonine-protein kinase PknB n=1 Tax=Roseimaritima multifibrata TaxID=1930274 RepID=A0A517MFG8_9BACT|nr:FHA domain-containing serine/threonine-protein kinase [Roseimaritima multifibrata]QDS93497.1 Serine/threonine-protein kinase PknB [Roseimaritima multifibrata]